MERHCTRSFASTLELAPTELAAGDSPQVAAAPPPFPTGVMGCHYMRSFASTLEHATTELTADR